LPIAGLDGKSLHAQGLTSREAYNLPFAHRDDDAMEAEQLNQIASTLAGLREREAQLRRFL
jgi:hypothetical protein